MVKKRIKKNGVKTKSLNFKIPESFSGLNFNQKIISVFLIALFIGIIVSLFPGNITGMQTKVGSSATFSFDMIKDILSSINKIIISVFSVVLPEENDPRIIYARVVLFASVLGLVYFFMKVISENPFVNFLVGIAIAYLTTFFMPAGLITGTGLIYNGTLFSVILIVPFLFLWYIYFILPKRKSGYVIRFIVCLIMLSIFQQDVLSQTTNVINNLLFVGRAVAFGAGVYSAIRIFTVKGGEEAEYKAAKKINKKAETIIYKLLGKVKE